MGLNYKQIDMSDNCSKQRRNLLLTSMALILFFHIGVNLGEELKLFGASVKIKKPDALIDFLLVIHVYFALRFYQYFYHDDANVAFKNQYRVDLDVIRNKVLMDYIFKSLPQGVTSITGNYTYTDISKTDCSGGVYEVKVNFPLNENGESTSEMIEIPKKIFRFNNVPVALKFILRGRVLTDYYLPLLLAIYGFIITLM